MSSVLLPNQGLAGLNQVEWGKIGRNARACHDVCCCASERVLQAQEGWREAGRSVKKCIAAVVLAELSSASV